jgi:hypothetical protein
MRIIDALAVFALLMQVSAQSAMAQNQTEQNIGTNNNSNLVRYENAIYGIRIFYPADWQKSEHFNVNRFWVDFTSPFMNSPNIFPAIVSLSIETLNQTLTPTRNEYVSTILEKAKHSLPDFRIIELKDNASLAGTSAFKIVYTFLSEDPTIQTHFQSMNLLILKDKKIYSVSYTESRSLYATYLPTVQKMTESFEFMK